MKTYTGPALAKVMQGATVKTVRFENGVSPTLFMTLDTGKEIRIRASLTVVNPAVTGQAIYHAALIGENDTE